jgi:D-3-phosphoglycerate dehydrogenase
MNMLKIVGVGDPVIPENSMEEIFRQQNRLKGEFQKASWGVSDPGQLQHLRSIYEEKGPGAVPAPRHILEQAADAQILVVHFTPVSEEILSGLPELKIIGVARAGVENIDVEAAAHRGVLVFNVTGRNAEAVSDFTIGLMLAESRNIARSHADLLQGNWRKQFVNTPYSGVLRGKTVGLVGYGQIGRLVARKLRGFGARIVVFDPYAPAETIQQDGCETTGINELFRQSDFISLHARLTAETRQLVSAELIAEMKPSAYFINTARAGLVDHSELITALQKKRIGGAALDVYELEPLPQDSPLLQLDNITLTSHLAGVTQDTYRLSMELLYKNLADFLEHGRQDNLVNPSAAERPDLQDWLAAQR